MSGPKSQLLIDMTDTKDSILPFKEFLTGHDDLSRPLNSYHVDNPE